MKENINEHDMTKKMMDIVRGGFKKLIKEDDSREYVIDVRPSDAAYKAELAKLQTVDASAEIKEFKIYPNEKNVKLNGVFKENNDSVNSGVHFNFMVRNEEPKITMQDVNLDNEFLNKLNGFFVTWKDGWLKELPQSYKPKTDEY